jgi:apolipoprotein N-acyltransferase
MYWLFYVTPAGWIVLSLYQGLYFGIFSLFFYVFTQTDNGSTVLPVRQALTANCLILPGAWCLLEYVRANLFGGIGWNLLGYSQYQTVPLIQISDITGVYGVSFLIVLINSLAFFSLRMMLSNRNINSKSPAKYPLGFSTGFKINLLFNMFIAVFIMSFVLVYGYKSIDRFSLNAKDKEQVKISVVQGNIGQMQKWDSAYKDYILNKYQNLTMQAAMHKPDIIIWPETSVPGYLNKDAKLMRRLQGFVKKINTPLLVGSPMAGLKDNTGTKELNSAVLFSKKADIIARYNKSHLVIFGEYIPFERFYPAIRRFFPLTGNFTPGDEYTIFKLSDIDVKFRSTFGCLICFEDIFPGIVRRFVKEGADFMVNITNDAWFGKSCAAYQHAGNSVFRAVENRRPFIRSANTGLSCFIDKTGAIWKRVRAEGDSLFVDGHITDTIGIAISSRLTFYTKYGDIFVLFCFAAIVIFAILFMIDYIRYHKYNN